MLSSRADPVPTGSANRCTKATLGASLMRNSAPRDGPGTVNVRRYPGCPVPVEAVPGAPLKSPSRALPARSQIVSRTTNSYSPGGSAGAPASRPFPSRANTASNLSVAAGYPGRTATVAWFKPKAMAATPPGIWLPPRSRTQLAGLITLFRPAGTTLRPSLNVTTN